MSAGNVLLTGASRGIGAALAPWFARDGYDLVLTARDQEALNRLADELRRRYGATCRVYVCDLARPRAAEELVAELDHDSIVVDVLVNNAGFATYGLFWEIDPGTALEMVQVNIVALTHLTRLLLPRMVERGRGRILNLASTAAFYPGPLMAAYYASKAYVLSFSEALADECRGTGVTVTALCPPATRSDFQARAGMEESKLLRRMMDVDTVARVGYRGFMRGERVVIPGWENRFLALVSRFLPRSTVASLVRQFQERESR
jgi:short-subunit dehydrogenase